MPALIRQIALISQSNLIPRGDVSKVSAAIQKQSTRDLGPIWGVSATVDAFDTLDDVPIGYWPILVMDNIDQQGAAGIHEDRNGQPFALVSAAAEIDEWSVTASHEALEMLVDPSGNRLVAGDADAEQRRVNYLVEVCDPSEASDNAYTCNGVLVSDFYTPNYFDPAKADGVRYSYTGKITEPRQVLFGGYLSWQDPESGSWWQTTWFDGDEPVDRELGSINQSSSGNVRAAIDRSTMSQTARFIGRGRRVAKEAGLSARIVSKATSANAAMWRDQVTAILGARQPLFPDRGYSPKVSVPGTQFDPPTVATLLPGTGASTQSAGYDSKQATLLGQFVEAAYTMFGDNPGDLLPPASANFPSGYSLLAAVQMRDFVIGSTGPQFYGFVAQQQANPNQFVLALRGTVGDIEWWDDFVSLGMIPFRVQGCGSVGAGFARIYDSIAIVEYATVAAVAAAAAPAPAAVQGSLADKMAALVARHRPAAGLFGAAAATPPTVSVSGHSLGSALATLYVLETVKRQLLQSPLICTFASPRVGDSTFVGAFNALGLQSWRFANTSDIVPLIPPQFLGFEHVDAFIPLSSAGKVKPSVGCWHALETYLSLIDPALQPSPECRLTPAQIAGRAAWAGTPGSAFEAAAPAPQPAAEDESVLAAAMTIVCPRVSQAGWLDALMAGFAKYGLNTDRRRAAAMGQFLVEAGAAFQEVVENLNYSAERAAQVFPGLFHTAEDAAPYAGNPVKFGNHVYANRLGNGNEASGDGFRFRGRGLIQLTGRTEYSDFGKTVGKTAEDVAVYCETPEGAAVSGCWYLSSRRCLPFADAWNINKITLLVNGRAMLGAQQRLNYANAFLKHLGG
jgi:predicted chitinase